MSTDFKSLLYIIFALIVSALEKGLHLKITKFVANTGGVLSAKYPHYIFATGINTNIVLVNERNEPNKSVFLGTVGRECVRRAPQNKLQEKVY